MDCCVSWLFFDKQNQIKYPGSFTRLSLSSFPFNAPWQLSLWLGGVPSTDPAGEGGSWKKEQVLHRFPFTEGSWWEALTGSHRAGFSILKELYLSPEIKLKVKAGLKASIVCPYSRLRSKFWGVLDFRKNLKCCFEGH